MVSGFCTGQIWAPYPSEIWPNLTSVLKVDNFSKNICLKCIIIVHIIKVFYMYMYILIMTFKYIEHILFFWIVVKHSTYMYACMYLSLIILTLIFTLNPSISSIRVLSWRDVYLDVMVICVVHEISWNISLLNIIFSTWWGSFE